MLPQDNQAFLFLALIGIPCGMVLALVFRRSKHPYLWTVTTSVLVASFVCMIVLGVWEALRSITDHGYLLGRAFRAGIGAGFLIAFVAPYACGGPAVFVGLLLQFLLQRGGRLRPRGR